MGHRHPIRRSTRRSLKGRLETAGHPRTNGRSRRILPVPVGAGERPFTEPSTAVRRRKRDRRATTGAIDLLPGKPPEDKLYGGEGDDLR